MKKEPNIIERRTFGIGDDRTNTYDLYLVEEEFMDTELVAVYVAKTDKQPYCVARYFPEDISEDDLVINLNIWGSIVSELESLKNK